LTAVAKSSQQPLAAGGGSSRYLVYGLALECDFSLISVDEVPAEDVETAIRLTRMPADTFRRRTENVAADPEAWSQHAILDGGAVYMKIQSVFEAIVAADGRQVDCLRPEEADQGSFEANLLNFVMSTALTQQGEEPLHATVLDLAGRAVALLGPSGAGKSTLAAFLVGRGARLVTDDMLRLSFLEGKGYAHYGPNRLKLLDEPVERLLPAAIATGYFNTVSGKLMVRPDDRSGSRREPLPLAALFWLGNQPPEQGAGATDVEVSRLGGLELIRVLTSSAMNIRDYAPQRLARQLRFVEQVARAMPVFALVYPRDYALLGNVADQIQSLVRDP
jgi:energy-coupling factor transporter ATP-binding protein EcfA2